MRRRALLCAAALAVAALLAPAAVAAHGLVGKQDLPIGIARGRREGAYVLGGACRARVWTREPTGVLELGSPGLRLGDLFAVWGQPLGRDRMLGFHAPVRVWLDGSPWRASPASAPLARGAQIVVQAGRPLAPVHGRYVFPPAGSAPAQQRAPVRWPTRRWAEPRSPRRLSVPAAGLGRVS